MTNTNKKMLIAELDHGKSVELKGSPEMLLDTLMHCNPTNVPAVLEINVLDDDRYEQAFVVTSHIRILKVRPN